MKEVMAIIRLNKMNETKQALSKAGISSFTAMGNVLGRGKGLVDYKILKGAEQGYIEAISQLGDGPRMISKRLLSIIVPDKKVKTTVQTIISTNQTGSPGDGKIFILPVSEAHKVRTAEKGDDVLDNED
ncbi:MAG: P-II family nitrogen regulator [Spirochaetales bacterium]|nr:P-II family nitrogen regulator [Spirochaetales bacterium]